MNDNKNIEIIPLSAFYNHRRFQETLDYKKPMNVYFENLQINDETT